MLLSPRVFIRMAVVAAAVGLPQMSAAESLSHKAKVAARFCLAVAETNTVDAAYLAKHGYAPKNAKNTEFNKYEMRERFGANGKSMGLGKVLQGKIRVKLRPNKPNKHGSYCTFEAAGHADPKNPHGPSAVETAAANAFVGVAKSRGYKLQVTKKPGRAADKHLVKGDVRMILGDSVSAKGVRMVRLSLQRTNR